MKPQIYLAFYDIFLEWLKPEVLPCIHMPVSHLSRCSTVCQQGKNKGVCAVPRERAERQHKALTAAAKHPCISVSQQLHPPHQLSSYWRLQGKLQRTRHKTLYLQVPWPLQGLPAQQEIHSGTDMRKHSTTVPRFRNKSSHSVLLTHVFWTTLEPSRFPRMSSVFWKLLLPRHKQEWAVPAELQDTAVLPLSGCTQTSHCSLCTNLHNSQE